MNPLDQAQQILGKIPAIVNQRAHEMVINQARFQNLIQQHKPYDQLTPNEQQLINQNIGGVAGAVSPVNRVVQEIRFIDPVTKALKFARHYDSVGQARKAFNMMSPREDYLIQPPREVLKGMK